MSRKNSSANIRKHRDNIVCAFNIIRPMLVKKLVETCDYDIAEILGILNNAILTNNKEKNINHSVL